MTVGTGGSTMTWIHSTVGGSGKYFEIFLIYFVAQIQ
jgi:hypothetical protein